MGQTIRTNNIEYFEPNDIFNTLNGQNTDANIPVNQEDLQMFVNLTVRVPKRDRRKNHGNDINSINNRRGFMNGSEISCNGEKIDLLTTSYVDVSYTEIKDNNVRNRELLGIKSIDISFDQQFFPQVTIQFSDIRGFSLMQPTELKYKRDNDKTYAEETAASFFSCLFAFPYPVFTLEVKGYYGTPVSFDLAVNEFKSQFNASTGNYDITVTFIGYMYGVYTDIPMSYVLTAPLFDGNNSNGENTIGEYFQKKVGEGVFTFPEYESEGVVRESSSTPIPDFLTFLRKYKELLEFNTSQLRNDNQFLSAINGINDSYLNPKKKIEQLENFKLICEDYRSYIFKINPNHDKDENGKDKKTVSFAKGKIGEEGAKEITKKINEYTNKVNDLVKDLGSNYGLNDKNNRHLEENDNKTFYIWKDIDYGVTFSPNENMFSIINNEIKNLREEINDSIKEINKNIRELSKSILNFVPTVENVYRMFYAYLDCFVYQINNAIKDIPENRSKEMVGLNDDKYVTDIPSKTNVVPPFPLIVRKSDNEIVYPLEVSYNFKEIDFVEKIYKNIKSFQNEYQNAIDEINNVSVENNNEIPQNIDFIPIINSDCLLGYKNPYKNVFKTNNDYGDFYGASLLIAKLFLLRLISYYFCNENTNFEKIGKIEAFNFYKEKKEIKKIILKAFECIDQKTLQEIYSNFLDKSGNFILNKNQNKCQMVLLDFDKYNETGDLEQIEIGDLYTYGNDSNTNSDIIFRILNAENANVLMKYKNCNWIDDNSEEKEKFYSNWDFNVTDNIKTGVNFYNDFLKKITFILNKSEGKYERALMLLLGKNDDGIFDPHRGDGLNNRLADSIIFKESGNGSSVGFCDMLRLLQIGCILYGIKNNHKGIKKSLEEYKIYTGDGFYGQYTKINFKMPVEIKEYLISFFEKWLNSNDMDFFGTLTFNQIIRVFENAIETLDIWKKKGDWLSPEKIKIVKESNFYETIANFGSAQVVLLITEETKDKRIGKNGLKYENVETAFNSFKEYIKKLFKLDEKEEEPIKEKDISKTENDIKKSIYYTLKNIYDKWLCYAGSNYEFELRTPSRDIEDRNGRKKIKNKEFFTNGRTSEFSRMVFIDSFFKDISNEMVMDLSSIKDLIDVVNNGDSSPSFFEIMSSIAEKNKSMILSLPLYNTDSLENIFKTHKYYGGSNIANNGPTYVFLYPGDNSHILSDEYYEFDDDGLTLKTDIAGTNGLNLSGQEQLGNRENAFPFRAFGVTYAKQNQNFFKNISINMDSPSLTDYSIANTLNIAKQGGKNGDMTRGVYASQSLYPIFANRSYVCKVDMMGCANITPLMHFQLNNTPMFKGVYVITNVTHNIQAGKFTTSFVGTRVAKYNYPVNQTIINIDEIENRISSTTVLTSSGNEKINSKGASNRAKPNDVVVENNIFDIPNQDSYKLIDFKRLKNKDGELIFSFEKGEYLFDDKLSSEIRNLVYKIGEKYGEEYNGKIKITSAYDPSEKGGDSTSAGRSCSSAHAHGYAMDIKDGNNGDSVELFRICAGFLKSIDQLLWECKGNQTTDNVISNCIHISVSPYQYLNACGFDSIKNEHNPGPLRGYIAQSKLVNKKWGIIRNFNELANDFKYIYADCRSKGLIKDDAYAKDGVGDKIVEWACKV